MVLGTSAIDEVARRLGIAPVSPQRNAGLAAIVGPAARRSSGGPARATIERRERGRQARAAWTRKAVGRAIASNRSLRQARLLNESRKPDGYRWTGR